jgi:hypothetical protein
MPERVFRKFRDDYHADISTLFDHDSLAIPDFEKSLRYDLELLRSSPAVPKHVKLYGFFYEINSGKLNAASKRWPCRRARPKSVPTQSVPSTASCSESIRAAGKPSARPNEVKRLPS